MSAPAERGLALMYFVPLGVCVVIFLIYIWKSERDIWLSDVVWGTAIALTPIVNAVALVGFALFSLDNAWRRCRDVVVIPRGWRRRLAQRRKEKARERE